ncbi:hypothetical protein [Pseudomonas sp. RIT-PI-AD]|uniref:hypothetical protein n=1 Tax=Pseudomonas sp. RIT-PI-AD TaxID=3035294 RepID=UPI0021D9668F|nr:hypothetical protein [Pseudomonas sp. RIT-PI-AD]
MDKIQVKTRRGFNNGPTSASYVKAGVTLEVDRFRAADLLANNLIEDYPGSARKAAAAPVIQTLTEPTNKSAPTPSTPGAPAPSTAEPAKGANKAKGNADKGNAAPSAAGADDKPGA